MRRWMAFCLMVMGTIGLARVAMAQDAAKPAEGAQASPAAHYYQLRFVVEEVNQAGKATNSRSYTTTVNTDKSQSASIRTGSRIPIATGSYSSAGNESPNTQFQYIDTGVNIDVHQVHEAEQKLSLVIKAEITSVGTPVEIAHVQEPVFRQNTWQSAVLIPVGKPTTIFSSDSVDNTGSMRVVLTATPVP